MNKFALLLNQQADRFEGLDENAYTALIAEYVAWVQDMTAKGRFVDGHKMANDAGRHLRLGSDGIEDHEGPFVESQEILGGMMIIQAEDYDEAVALARTHPHLVHHTSMAIHQLDE